jgi:hypothetical protein
MIRRTRQATPLSNFASIISALIIGRSRRSRDAEPARVGGAPLRSDARAVVPRADTDRDAGHPSGGGGGGGGGDGKKGPEPS